MTLKENPKRRSLIRLEILSICLLVCCVSLKTFGASVDLDEPPWSKGQKKASSINLYLKKTLTREAF